MPERDDFLKALQFNADDHTARLVFADWLDEHGDPDLAEVYRLFVALVRMRRPLQRPEDRSKAWRMIELVDRTAREAEPAPGGLIEESAFHRLLDFLPSGGGKMLHRLIGVAFLRHTPTATGRLGEALTEGRLLKALKVAEAFAVKAVSATDCEAVMQSLVGAVGGDSGIEGAGREVVNTGVDLYAAQAGVVLCDPSTTPEGPLPMVAGYARRAAVNASEDDRFEQTLRLINRIQAYHVGVVSRLIGRAGG